MILSMWLIWYASWIMNIWLCYLKLYGDMMFDILIMERICNDWLWEMMNDITYVNSGWESKAFLVVMNYMIHGYSIIVNAMNCTYDTLWVLCTSYEDVCCIGPKRGCQLTILGIALITVLIDGLMKRVSTTESWTFDYAWLTVYWTGQYHWTHAKEPIGHTYD